LEREASVTIFSKLENSKALAEKMLALAEEKLQLLILMNENVIPQKHHPTEDFDPKKIIHD
jgi:hypothetical protein